MIIEPHLKHLFHGPFSSNVKEGRCPKKNLDANEFFNITEKSVVQFNRKPLHNNIPQTDGYSKKLTLTIVERYRDIVERTSKNMNDFIQRPVKHIKKLLFILIPTSALIFDLRQKRLKQPGPSLTQEKLKAFCESIEAAAKSWNGWNGIDPLQLSSGTFTAGELFSFLFHEFKSHQNRMSDREFGTLLIVSKKAMEALLEVALENTWQTTIRYWLEGVNAILTFSASEIEERFQRDIKQLDEEINIKDRTVRIFHFSSEDEIKPHSDGIGALDPNKSLLSLIADVEHFLSAYRPFLSTQDQSSLEEASKLLRSAVTITGLQNIIETAILLPSALREARLKWAALIAQDIQDLSLGGKIIIPSLVSYAKGVHAVVYEIQRISESDYQFSIFNTGLGGEFGQSWVRSLFSGFFSEFEIPIFSHLPVQAVAEKEFLCALIDHNASQWDREETILQQLTQKYPGVQATQDRIDKQTWGSCGFSPHYSYLKHVLPSSLFPALNFDAMLRARGDLTSLLDNPGNSTFSHNEMTSAFLKARSCQILKEEKSRFAQFCGTFHESIEKVSLCSALLQPSSAALTFAAAGCPQLLT